jgi:hypothetical protein
MNHDDECWAFVRSLHAPHETAIPFPTSPAARDVVARYLSRGAPLWVDWHPEADELLRELEQAGFAWIRQ